jgi:hypothetical protein
MGMAGDEQCPGILQTLITAYRFGELEPQPPWCELCGEHHWPAGHQLVCEVIVRTREEAKQYTDMTDRSEPWRPAAQGEH